MLRKIEHGLLNARWQDSLPSAHAVVQSRQAEALAVAYLLTGDRDRTLALAEAALLAFLGELKTLAPNADPRARVLVQLGRHFLHGEYAVSPQDRPELIADAVPEKYAVENQRERTLAALSRLDDGERAALLLRDMCGIEPGELHEGTHDTPAAPIETARERLRQSLNVPDGEPLRPLLVEAGFDGPRDDLWPRLEGPYAAIQRREKRRRQLLTFGVLGVVALLAIVSIAAIVGPVLINDEADAAAAVTPTLIDDDLVIETEPPVVPTPTPTPSLPPVGDVPDTLLAQTHHDGRSNNPYTVLSAFDPVNNDLLQIHDDDVRVSGQSSHPTRISPDGKQLMMLHEEWTDTEIHVKLTAFDSTTFERLWEAEVGSFAPPAENSGTMFRLATTISSDRIYVAIVEEDTPEHATMLVFGRQDGALRETRKVNLAPLEMGLDFRGNVFLYVSPDETYLTLALQVWSYNAQDTSSSHIYRLALPSLTRNYRVVAEGYSDAQRTFGMWGANLTPDGDNLYSLANWSNEPPQVEFLNLESGDVTVVELPLIEPEGHSYTPTASVVSHDGRWLYVLEQTSGTAAIINLAEQRIERSFPIDVSAFDGMFGVGPNRRSFGYAAELSPDGSRLYLNTGDTNDAQGRQQAPGNGVWIIDTSQWRIVDYWPAEGQVGQIFSTPGEPTLIFESRYYENERSYQSVSRIGIHNGKVIEEPVAIPSLPDNNSYTLTSMMRLYREQYGRSPTVAGEEMGGPVDLQTLPRIEASATIDSVAAGVGTTVEARVLDPASGEVLSSHSPNVRFDSNSTVTAILKAEDQPRQIIVLANVEQGVYRGSVTFPATGRWTIDVAVSSLDGVMSVSTNIGWVDVAPTFTGSDDRLYQFMIASLPERPFVDDEITIRLNLVDIESGVPLPEGVSLTTEQPTLQEGFIESMPERIDVALVFTPTGGYGGFRTALLYQISPGVYEGATQLKDAGVWAAEIRFQPPDARRTLIPAGTIEVVER